MYKQIIPATDWLYINRSDNYDALSIYYVAAWGLSESGNVFGLISMPGTQEYDESGGCAQLVQVPPNKQGVYKHKDELTPQELQALKQGGHLKQLSNYSEEGIL